jgi:NAD(P)-dependent dehydrogenase (short-subunit alcohol dehydrogenase family)
MDVALVTGPNSGIGREIALGLANHGLHIIAAGRSEQRVGDVINEIHSTGGTAEFLELDLSSLDSARDAARTFESTERKIAVLVNNAGIGIGRKPLTIDGFEPRFGVNHLGHFMLTFGLRRTFRPGTRIVQVSSSVHFRATEINFDQLRKKPSLRGVNEYAVSKLANVLFVRELARQQPDWNAYAVHPGFVDTGIIPGFMRPFLRNRLLTPVEGAQTPLWCAIDPVLESESGHYYARMARDTPSEPAQDDDLARELWKQSEVWCGVAPQH